MVVLSSCSKDTVERRVVVVVCATSVTTTATSTASAASVSIVDVVLFRVDRCVVNNM
jgi:hypothetical protein